MRIPLLPTCLLLASAAFAQDAPPAYRLTFTLHEMENGKRVNARTYSMLMETNTFTKLNVGAKVSMPTGQGSSQYTFYDVGVNVRAKVQEQSGQVRVTAEVESSSLNPQEHAGGPMPQVRQIRADIDALVTAGHPTTVVTLDDPGGAKHFEIEVTAARVK
jgi:hypothetical protein